MQDEIIRLPFLPFGYGTLEKKTNDFVHCIYDCLNDENSIIMNKHYQLSSYHKVRVFIPHSVQTCLRIKRHLAHTFGYSIS